MSRKPPSTCLQSYEMGGGFWVSFKLNGGTLQAIWSPTMPTKAQFQRMLSAYRAARRLYLGKLGVHAAVIEL